MGLMHGDRSIPGGTAGDLLHVKIADFCFFHFSSQTIVLLILLILIFCIVFSFEMRQRFHCSIAEIEEVVDIMKFYVHLVFGVRAGFNETDQAQNT